MAIEIKGLKEFQNKLKDMSSRMQKLDGTHEVPLTELLTDIFVSQCSAFSSASALFDASGFKVESKEDFAAIPDDAWNSFIKANTSYASWDDMLQAAVAEWTKKRLGC